MVWRISTSRMPAARLATPACRTCRRRPTAAATSPPLGKNASLNAPIVPGAAMWATTSSGSSSGHIRFMLVGFSTTKTTASASSISIAVRGTVAIVPSTSTPAAIHQPP